MTVETLKRGFPWNLGRHYLISSRGCPYDCAYCCNSALKKLMGDKLTLRFRSVESLMSEIRSIINTFSFVDTFAIMDDSFFFKPKGWLEFFCDEFKKTGKYFGVLLHPKTVSRDRMKMLIDAGLIGIQMGLQSGSERVSKQIFNRPETVSQFIEATRIIDEFSSQLRARTYDVIVDNPFETDEDQEATIKVLCSLKKPFLIDLFSLTLYPGTALYEQAINSGHPVSDDLAGEDKNFIHYKPTLLNRLTWMTHNTPSALVLFFLRHYKKPWGNYLFLTYDELIEKRLRLLLRFVKRKLLSYLKKT